MGAVLLASKIEEKLKVVREVGTSIGSLSSHSNLSLHIPANIHTQILYVFHHMYLKRKKLPIRPLELGGEQYSSWKTELMRMETYVLKELGFTMYNIMDHPHKYLLYFVKLLDGGNALAQKSWSFLNDAMRLDLCLRYKVSRSFVVVIDLSGSSIVSAGQRAPR
jgi:hypothetical protein